MKQKGYLALKCWIQEHTQSEVHVDSLLSVDFNQQTKCAYVKKVHHLSNKKAVKVSIPGVFKDEEWVSFETGMIEYFKAHTVSNGIQMHYMLCDDKATPALNVVYTLSLEEQAYWLNPRVGPPSTTLALASTSDRDWCWSILAAITQETPMRGWVMKYKQDQDFVEAWEALCAFYDGTAQRSKRVLSAQKVLNKIHYKDEYGFSFSTFVTQLET